LTGTGETKNITSTNINPSSSQR